MLALLKPQVLEAVAKSVEGRHIRAPVQDDPDVICVILLRHGDERHGEEAARQGRDEDPTIHQRVISQVARV